MIQSPASTASAPRPRSGAVLFLLALIFLGLGFGTAQITQAAPDTEASVASPGNTSDERAWAVLSEVRDQLRSGSPHAAAFTQTFVPSGFSSGEEETGTLYVDLPKCLRFEYSEPFPKNFLLCGDWVYTWNPGDPSGRRFLINDSEAAGIDLLRLEVEALADRYRAALQSDDSGRRVIQLVPMDENADIREAAIEVDASDSSSGPLRLLALSYVDHSGNRTRFNMSDHGKLATKADFETPDLEWLED